MKLSEIPKEAAHPAGMLLASSLNFFGAIAAMIAVPSSRNNPFFYTAMATSSIYMISNGLKLYQELSKPKERPAFLQEITVQKEGEQALTNYYRGR